MINMPQGLKKMLVDYSQKHGDKNYASYGWTYLNNLHIRELLNSGYDKFKHTIACYYFTWIAKPGTSQFDFLANNLNKEEVSRLKKQARELPLLTYTYKDFNFMTLLLWQYAKNQGLEKELAKLSEPQEGSPPAINFEGRLISQDLANSLLEIDSISKNIRINSIKSILEIGAGYGRSAYVWLTLYKIKKYIIVDIPPALYISQKYLTNQFPGKKVFKYRNFKSFANIKNEYEKADLVFLMPWQMEMLPKKSIDLSLAIDSINEMRLDVIKSYFKIIDKLGTYFYMKGCKESDSGEGIIRQENYPPDPKWKCLMDRDCRVQADYFETLYELSDTSG